MRMNSTWPRVEWLLAFGRSKAWGRWPKVEVRQPVTAVSPPSVSFGGLHMRLFRHRLLIAGLAAAFSAVVLASTASAGHVTLPAKMAAIGDSLSTAWGASGGASDDKAHSFSTGTGLMSHFVRLSAMRSTGRENLAKTGIRLENLIAQDVDGNPLASNQIAKLPTDTRYVTVTIGSSDVCRNSRPALGLIQSRAIEMMDQLRDRLVTADDPTPPTIIVLPVPNWVQLWTTLHYDPAVAERWAAGAACPQVFGESADRNAALAYIQGYNQHLSSACDQANAADFRCRYAGAVSNIAWSKGLVSTHDYFHPSVAGQALLSRLSWGVSPYRLRAFGLRFVSQPRFRPRRERLSLNLHTAPNARVNVRVLTTSGRKLARQTFQANAEGNVVTRMRVRAWSGQSVLRLVFTVRINDEMLKVRRRINA
jgi:lysophospholipase L1-like esterase